MNKRFNHWPSSLHMILLQQDNAEKIVSLYIHDYPLCEEALLEIFNYPFAQSMLTEYISRYKLPVSVQVKMLQMPYGLDLLKAYIDRYEHLDKPAQMQIMRMENAEDALHVYAQKTALTSDAQVMLFDSPKVEQLIDIYTQYHYLTTPAQIKLLKSGNRKLFISYCQRWKLSFLALRELLKNSDLRNEYIRLRKKS